VVKTSGAYTILRRAAVQAAFEAVGQVDQGQAYRQVEAAFRRFYPIATLLLTAW